MSFVMTASYAGTDGDESEIPLPSGAELA